MFDTLTTVAKNIVVAPIFVPLALIFMVVAQWVCDHTFRVANDSRDNEALVWRHMGIWSAMALAMMAAIVGNIHDGFWKTLWALVGNGAAMTMFVLVAQTINDKFIVTKLSNSEAISNNNVAVGIVEFGGLVATGLIAFGSFWGVSKNFWLPAITFFLIGQVCLVAIFRIFDHLHPVDFLEKVKQGNVAAATIVAAVLVSLGLVVKTAVAGEFTGWLMSLALFVVYTAIGAIMVLITYWAVAKIVYAGDTTSENDQINANNVVRARKAAIGLVALMFIVSSLI